MPLFHRGAVEKGRFGAGSEGAVLLRLVAARVSTADSTLMVGRGFNQRAITAAAT